MQKWGRLETYDLGFKGCVDKAQYIAYPKALDKSDFLDQVNCYTILSQIVIEKHQIASTSEITLEPSRVTCENNGPVLVN